MPLPKKITLDRKSSTTLTIKQKAEIIEYKEKHKNEKNTIIAGHFSIIFKVKIDARSIGNYWKNKENIKTDYHKNP